MYNIDESISTVNNHIRKLKDTVTNNPTIKIGTASFVKKNTIDDILCCIEGCLPEEYKNIAKTNPRALRSLKTYQLLIATAKKKFFIGSCYKINSINLINISDTYLKHLREDLVSLT
ncbi:hypothetical protein IJD34_02335 [bacterium]|nr:hypothetical protein [bacterium]